MSGCENCEFSSLYYPNMCLACPVNRKKPGPGRCDIEGKFRKAADLVLMEGDSSDGEKPERWTECRFCCSKEDLWRYFGDRERVPTLRKKT